MFQYISYSFLSYCWHYPNHKQDCKFCTIYRLQSEEKSEDIEDEDIDPIETPNSTIDHVDFQRPLTSGTDMNLKPSVWVNMKYVELDDVIVGLIPASTKENPKEVSQEFETNYEG